MLNLAVCPSAACSPISSAKAPHTIALLAARPPAASAEKPHGYGLKHRAESPEIKSREQGYATAKHHRQRTKSLLVLACLGICPQPNWAVKRTPTRAKASPLSWPLLVPFAPSVLRYRLPWALGPHLEAHLKFIHVIALLLLLVAAVLAFSGQIKIAFGVLGLSTFIELAWSAFNGKGKNL